MLPTETGQPSIADGIERPLDPAWIDLQRLTGWIVFTIAAPLLLIAALVAVLPLTAVWARVLLFAAWGALAAALACLAYAWPPAEYRRFRYQVDAWGIVIRSGIVWRKVISVPRSRVQHTDVAQGPLERRYGLATLSIYTAGTEYARIDLPGLPYARALSIRDHLLPGRQHGADDGT